MNNTIDPSIIANSIGQGLKSGSAKHVNTGNGNFGDVLRNTAQSAIDTMRQSESVSAQAVTGKADLNDVVTAVTSAELTLQTVVAIRDRAVSALQEILRMPI
ncbi:MAG: flagellar hook-basal body complex protein FliE [Bdellovibrionales bacterium]